MKNIDWEGKEDITRHIYEYVCSCIEYWEEEQEKDSSQIKEGLILAFKNIKDYIVS